MKRLYPLLFTLFVLGQSPLYGQVCDVPTAQQPLEANAIRANITNGGDLFYDGSNGQFRIMSEAGTPTTISAAGLWLGGLDAGGQLKLAAQTYGRGAMKHDYYPGPIPFVYNGTQDIDCAQWDTIWTVHRHEILAHLLDYQDNQAIDDPLQAIMGWPGEGNPYFEDIWGFPLPQEEDLTNDLPDQGLAPFADTDGDGIYDPMQGDYPMIPEGGPLPEQINWAVFNDQFGLSLISNGATIQAEVHLTTWAYQCEDSPQLDRTVFASYDIINRAIEPIDSLRLGLWVDFDLGCTTDDYLGSAPELHTFFAYNQDNADDLDCVTNVQGFGENPPVQAITFLNRPLYGFTYHLVGQEPDAPQNSVDYYNLLNGRFWDDSPVYESGDGYNEAGTTTNYAFSGDPNDAGEWSMLSEGLPVQDYRAIGSVELDRLDPNHADRIVLAFTYVREPGRDHLGNVEAMYSQVEQLQAWYDSGFSEGCNFLTDLEEVPAPVTQLSVFPNPSQGQFHLSFGGKPITQVSVFDATGRLVHREQGQFWEQHQLDLSGLPTGLYWLRAEQEGQMLTQKLIIE
jgi:hypothetical protein